MMDVDALNTLDKYPLPGISEFVKLCILRNVGSVYLTGTNTEPMLYKYHKSLVTMLRNMIPKIDVGIRSNGTLVVSNPDVWKLYDKASITICSIDPDTNRSMMGGDPPDLVSIMKLSDGMDLKINVVLGPENVKTGDIFRTLDTFRILGIKRVNIREPYGQPHVGNPIKGIPESSVLGMPTYNFQGMNVTYWDVHYVEVESVNLYANGLVSENYPITLGYSKNGEVHDQSYFPGGRIREQWNYSR